MNKFLMTILCFACAVSFAFGNTKKTDPWVEWRRGYELFLEGDKYMRRNQLEDALSAYKRSRDTYKSVLEANTGWNQNLINSKISACETQILKIEKRLRESGKKIASDNPTKATPQTPAIQEVNNTASTTASTSDDGYKRKYFNLYIEVENLRKQLRTQAQAAKNIDALLKEKRLAEEKVSTLQRSIENLRRQMSRPEEELKNAQKQLIAERLKNEQLVLARNTDSSTIQSLQNETKALNNELAALQKKLRDSINSKDSLNDTVKDLRGKLSDLQDEREDQSKEIKKFKEEIASLEKTISNSKDEIKKLNNWIDELNKKKGDSDKLSASIVDENRNIKNEITSLQAKIRQLESENRNVSSKLAKAERDFDASSQTVESLTKQKKNLENELKSTRELYVSRINADKLAQAELATLRAEQKKNAAALQTYINRNSELSAMLDTKDSTSRTYAQKIDTLQKEIEDKDAKIKKLDNIIANTDTTTPAKKIASLRESLEKIEHENSEFRRSIDKLKTENNSLAAQLNSAKNELAIFRAPAAAPAKKAETASASSTDNKDYQKLLAAFNDLKSKYDFLSAEIESLNKPLADVEEKSSEISSDKELANFLLKAAADAAAANDYISAAWYFSELKKQSPANDHYTFGYALYSSVASDRANAAKIVSELKNSREKYILEGVIAMLNGKKSAAEDCFEKAEDYKFISSDIKNLYAKDLPLIMNLFTKKGDMADNLKALQGLLK